MSFDDDAENVFANSEHIYLFIMATQSLFLCLGSRQTIFESSHRCNSRRWYYSKF